MVNPMELYKVDSFVLIENPSTNRILELLNVYYEIEKKASVFGFECYTPRIGVRFSWIPRAIEFWPAEGPINKVAFGSSSRLDELLRNGIIKINSSYTHGYQEKPMISFQIADEPERKLRKYGLSTYTNHLFVGANINIYLEPPDYPETFFNF